MRAQTEKPPSTPHPAAARRHSARAFGRRRDYLSAGRGPSARPGDALRQRQTTLFHQLVFAVEVLAPLMTRYPFVGDDRSPMIGQATCAPFSSHVTRFADGRLEVGPPHFCSQRGTFRLRCQPNDAPNQKFAVYRAGKPSAYPAEEGPCRRARPGKAWLGIVIYVRKSLRRASVPIPPSILPGHRTFLLASAQRPLTLAQEKGTHISLTACGCHCGGFPDRLFASPRPPG